MLKNIVAGLRFVTSMTILVVGSILVVVTGPIPIVHDGSRLCAWILTWTCRLFLLATNVSVAPFDRARIRQHRGFIFANHQSYLETIIVFSVRPVRFLAKASVQESPLAGILARRIDTVFVARSDKDSRAASREVLAQVTGQPPVMIYPEGMIATTFELQPFRHGAFEIAINSGLPYLPLVYLYDPIKAARWIEDNMLVDFWRLLRQGPITTRVHVLDVVQPQDDDDPAALAEAMWQSVNALYAPTIPD